MNQQRSNGRQKDAERSGSETNPEERDNDTRETATENCFTSLAIVSVNFPLDRRKIKLGDKTRRPVCSRF